MASKGKECDMWYHGEAGDTQGVWPMVAHRTESRMLFAERSYLERNLMGWRVALAASMAIQSLVKRA